MNLELFPCSLEVWEARVVRIAVLEILITLYIKARKVRPQQTNCITYSLFDNRCLSL